MSIIEKINFMLLEKGISKKELKLLNGESETLTATVTEGVTGTIKWEHTGNITLSATEGN